MKGKFLIIFCVIFVVIGVGLGVFGMYKLDWNFEALDTRVFEEKFYEIGEEQPALTKVVVDTAYPINVVKGEKLKLTYYEESSYPTNITYDENGVLSISTVNRKKWDWKIFKFKEFTMKFQLEVPDGIDLDIDSINTTINIGGLNFNSLIVNSVNLNLTMNNCVGKSVNIDSTNTILTVKDTMIEDMSCEAVNLSFHESVMIANKITLDSVNISMKLTIDGSASEYNVAVDTVNGSKNVPNAQGSDPNKVVIIEAVNLSGYLKHTKQ